MINFVEGKIESRGLKSVTIRTVSGVGYKVFVAEETLNKLPERGGDVKLWTHLYVRENALELYGFLRPAELDFFETMINVPGIGPKTGLGVLNVAPIDTLRRAIASGDTTYLTKVSGIGRKTAEKIIFELKEKMAGKGVTVDAPELKEEIDVIEALVTLGYSQREAREALSLVPPQIISIEKRVKEALSRLGGKK